jgi:hypothetical protein
MRKWKRRFLLRRLGLLSTCTCFAKRVGKERLGPTTTPFTKSAYGRDFKPQQYMKFWFESFSFNMDAINHVLWSYKENSEQLSDSDVSLVGTTTN